MEEKRKNNVVPFLLGAILLVAFGTFLVLLVHEHNNAVQSGGDFIAGDSTATTFGYFSNDNGTFNGEAFSFTPGYTSPIELRYTTEHALWVNCSSVNVTGLLYEVGNAAGMWRPGAVAMTPCLNNASRYELTDKAFTQIRINISANNGTAGQLPNATSKLVIAFTGK